MYATPSATSFCPSMNSDSHLQKQLQGIGQGKPPLSSMPLRATLLSGIVLLYRPDHLLLPCTTTVVHGSPPLPTTRQPACTPYIATAFYFPIFSTRLFSIMLYEHSCHSFHVALRTFLLQYSTSILGW